jgi:hypothetical protein
MTSNYWLHFYFDGQDIQVTDFPDLHEYEEGKSSKGIGVLF